MTRDIGFRTKLVLALFICTLMLGSITNLPAFAEEEPLVKSIVVRGNEHIDTALIQSAITKTQLDRPAIEDNILDDMHAIYDLGYFYDVRANFEQAPGGVRVVFVVDENPIVDEIIFKGASKAPVHQFISQMQVQPGDVLNVNFITEDLRKLPDWVLREYGIAVMPVDLRADEDGVVEIEIAETVIKDIKIDGNEKTRDFVIERELTIAPGDVLNMNELNRSMRNILMLGFFDEISRSFQDDPDNPNETTLTIHVKERKTGTGSAAVGYSTQDGLIGILDIAEENFLGRGQRINAYLELGGSHHVYELGFYEPYIDDQGTSLGVNVYKRGSTVSRRLLDPLEYDSETDPLTSISGRRNTYGGDISLGRRLTDNTRGRVTLRAQNNSYELDSKYSDEKYDLVKSTIDDRWYDDYNTRTIGLGLTTNTTDHPFFPTEGFKNNVQLEVGTKLLGGSSSFSKIDMEHSRYLEVRDGGYVFAVRAKGGRVLTGELEENEQFRIGGSESLRGYTRGSEGLRGDKMFLTNAEFRFPIVERVHGVVFTDWGRAWEEEEEISLTDLKNSYGLGVRLDTPLGLMRFDYGWGLDEDEKRSGAFSFGLGQTF